MGEKQRYVTFVSPLKDDGKLPKALQYMDVKVDFI
jgi:hypothetical protein